MAGTTSRIVVVRGSLKRQQKINGRWITTETLVEQRPAVKAIPGIVGPIHTLSLGADWERQTAEWFKNRIGSANPPPVPLILPPGSTPPPKSAPVSEPVNQLRTEDSPMHPNDVNHMAALAFGHTLRVIYMLRQTQAERLGIGSIVSLDLLPGRKLAFRKGKVTSRWGRVALTSRGNRNKFPYSVTMFAPNLIPTVLPFATAAPLEETWSEDLQGYVYEMDWANVMPPMEKQSTVGKWEELLAEYNIRPGEHPQYKDPSTRPRVAAEGHVVSDSDGRQGEMEIRRPGRHCLVSVILEDDFVSIVLETERGKFDRKVDL